MAQRMVEVGLQASYGLGVGTALFSGSWRCSWWSWSEQGGSGSVGRGFGSLQTRRTARWLPAATGRGRAVEHVWEVLRVAGSREGERGGPGEHGIDGARRDTVGAGGGRGARPCREWSASAAGARSGLGLSVHHLVRGWHGRAQGVKARLFDMVAVARQEGRQRCMVEWHRGMTWLCH